MLFPALVGAIIDDITPSGGASSPSQGGLFYLDCALELFNHFSVDSNRA